MDKALLEQRLAAVRKAKEEHIAQINALIGRELELTELLALLAQSEPPVG